MDDLNLSMFRANDIRTPADRLPEPLARRLAQAEAVYFADVVGTTGVVLAHDARASGPRMLEIAAEEYRAAGLDVLVVPGITGACQLYYAAMRHPDLAAVMIGASHNPAGDTGRKLMAPGLAPLALGLGPQGGLTRIKQLYVEGARRESASRGRFFAFDALPSYVADSLRWAKATPGCLRGFRLLHDYVYGAGGRELMVGFAATETSLEPLHYAADGMFRLGAPNPLKQDVIAEGMQALRDGDYALGMFYDGDADRLDVYLGKGRYLGSSFVYAAILPQILKRHDVAEPCVLVDTKTNPLAAVELARCGVHVRLIRSGHSYIKDAMLRDPNIVGTVEETAHFYEAFRLDGRRYCTENTLYFSLTVALAFRRAPRRFEELAALQARSYRARDWGFRFPSDEARLNALETVCDHARALGADIITHLPDGSPLEGYMMRLGIPFEITAETIVPDQWLQLVQRVSTSEDGLARWEAVGSPPELVQEMKSAVARIAAQHGAGEEYQG